MSSIINKVKSKDDDSDPSDDDDNDSGEKEDEVDHSQGWTQCEFCNAVGNLFCKCCSEGDSDSDSGLTWWQKCDEDVKDKGKAKAKGSGNDEKGKSKGKDDMVKFPIFFKPLAGQPYNR